MARVMLVDDETSILNVLSSIMKAAGHEPIALARGDSAIDALKKDKCDLVITDLRMSPVDGMKVLAAAKKLYPNMPVVMLTGYASEDTRQEAKELGAYDYVTKPFQMAELLDTVEQALHSDQPEAAS